MKHENEMTVYVAIILVGIVLFGVMAVATDDKQNANTYLICFNIWMAVFCVCGAITIIIKNNLK